MPIRLSGLTSGLDTDAIVQELVSAYSLKTENYTKEQTKLSWKQEAWKTLNSKIYSLYTSVSNLRYSSAYATKKANSSDVTKASVKASEGAVNGTQKLNVLSTAQSGYLTGAKLDYEEKKGTDGKVKSPTLQDLGFEGESASFAIKTKDEDGNDKITTVDLTAESTLEDVISSLQEAGLNASFDTNNKRIFVSSKATGAEGDFDIVATGKDEVSTDEDGNETTTYVEDADSVNALKALGLYYDDEYEEGEANKIDGLDAQIRLNGVLYTSANNSFSINGLSINAQGVTGDGDENAITITTSTDTQAIYDKIKDFLTEYNNVINEMTKLYNADSARGYEPLTDEEKDAMSETQIEKWETKIKDALLRRDSTLDNVMSAMMTSMSQAVEIDGQKYSFSSFGIHTMGFLNAAENEHNAYHIDGDEDDENTSGNQDKLMAAITNDPNTVVDFMKQMTTNLYNAIDQKMKSTELSSAYKVYNDKEMDKQYKNYTKLISNWEDKVAEKEEYYYKKFSAMESALATLQNQTNSLAGLLGG